VRGWGGSASEGVYVREEGTFANGWERRWRWQRGYGWKKGRVRGKWGIRKIESGEREGVGLEGTRSYCRSVTRSPHRAGPAIRCTPSCDALLLDLGVRR